MRLAYYPGCSLHGTASEFDVSVREICKALDIELQELDDWSCCGATAAHALNRDLSVAAPARNLAIAQKLGLDLVVPCAACYHTLKKADHLLRGDAALAGRIRDDAGIDYTGGVNVLHILHVLTRPEVLEKLKAAVKKPLKGPTFGAYYGCLIVRPPDEMGHVDDPENPQRMEQVLHALGARTVDWSYKTDCCGASFAIGRTDIAVKLIAKLFKNIVESGIDAVAVACPLCQANLDTRQPEASAELARELHIPVFYITELVGMALDLAPVKKTLRKHITSVQPALEKLS